MLRKVGNGWMVVSRTGRNMGTYSSKTEARKRLKQIEKFSGKHLPSKDFRGKKGGR